MYRLMGILLVVLWPALSLGGERTTEGTAAILIPDPDYVPKVGDRAVLYSLDTEKFPADLWCATTSQDCRNFIKNLFATEGDEAKKANDPATDATIVHLALRTDVQLLSVETVEIEGAKEEPPLKCTYFAIRVLSGPFQGQTLYTLNFHITRLIAPQASLALEAAPETGALEIPDSAPAPAQIALETTNAPKTDGAKAQLPEPPAPTPAPTRIELESPDIPATYQAESKPIEPSAPVPAPLPTRIELETPDAPPEPNRDTPGAAAVAPAPLSEASSPPEPVGLEPAAPVQDAPTPLPAAAPAPTPRADVTPEESAKPVVSTGPSRAAASTSPAPRPESQVKETLVSNSSESPANLDPPAPLALPLAPLPESKPKRESPDLRSEIPTHRPPAISSPAAQATGSRPQGTLQTLPKQARALVSAPVKPLSALEMLTAARERDTAGKAIEALVAYRVLERTHPGSPQARIAVERIQGLTERLEVDGQEVRAALVMKQARAIEASGNRSLALGYFQQIVKVYPKTPTARLAAERIKTIGTSRPTVVR
ncbi:hypothetical protein SAMN05444166_0026 [Singulisphaera sp. GP187]|uniref:tetratricopeptide repeat protein n=1 Tax=Singulisphaera sp. GP187 TaxID=1882752 RepID=UPI00092CB1D9|nr:hypothetical protein [Singulisphaera sp. GP187]SIN67829.1 hypothetical protein SAMN05444166_0026 [Singulisphaera sp. GP187]